MTQRRLVLMLYFFMVAHKAVCQTLLMLNRWTEYCTELYNHKANRDPSVLGCPQTDTEDDQPILRKEVEACSTIIEEREVGWS